MEVVDYNLPEHELADYGIDWAAVDNDEVVRLYWQRNPPRELPDDDIPHDRFAQPRRFVEVRVPEPINALGAEPYLALDRFLAASAAVDMTATHPALRRQWWTVSLQFLMQHHV